MTGLTRRAAIGSAIGTCVLSAATMAVPTQAAFNLPIPATPMRLTRRIERALRGGASLTVTREWEVTFAAQGRGAAIRGQQISAKVDAPAALEPLAAIEEARSTDSMFPIMLSGTGTILAAGLSTTEADLEAAIKEAEKMIKQRGGPASTQAQRLSYLAQLQQAGGSLLEQMPRDLFYPTEESARSVRPVDLPNGTQGEFEFTYAARCAPGKSWLEHAERQIVTRIGEDERRASEIWTLTRAGAPLQQPT